MKFNGPKFESLMENQQGQCGVELFITLCCFQDEWMN